MELGILVSIVSGFGKKGLYHSQEIGLAKALSKLGHSVTIYKCVPKGDKYYEEKLSSDIKIKYLPVNKLGVHGFVNPKVLSTGLDGLLIFSDTQIFLPFIFNYCERNNIQCVPYIGITHSFQRNLKSKLMDLLFKIGTLRYYKKYSVLAKTTSAQEDLLKLGISQCEVAPVGLDISELKTNFLDYKKEEIRHEYGYAPDDTIISFVARLKPEKRPLDLITIFLNASNNPKHKLLIVGEGELEESIRSKIESAGIASQVVIINRVKYDEMWKVHFMSDYFINLRAEEIFGMAVMEAVYYQSSVLAIDAPGPTTILNGMEGHHICKTDKEIEDVLIKSKISATDLSESSTKILENFTWAVCAEKFVSLTTRREKKND